MVRCAQPRKDHVTDDPGRPRRSAQRPLVVDDVGDGVLHPTDQGRAGRDDPREQFVIDISSVDDVKPARLQRGLKRGRLGAGGRGHGRVAGDRLQDVEVQVQLDAPVVLVGPQRPGHPRHCREDRAVDRREPLQRLGLATGVQGNGLGRQFVHDRPSP